MKNNSVIFKAEGPVVINKPVVIGLLTISGLGIILAMISGSVFCSFLNK